MDPVEKNMLIGAFATAGVDLALEAWFRYQEGLGTPPVGKFPYMTVLTPALPPLDDWLAEAGVPLAFYLLGKGLKKDSLVQMSKGGAIYGTGQLVGCTLYRSVQQVAPARYVLATRRV